MSDTTIYKTFTFVRLLLEMDQKEEREQTLRK